jgi:ribose transport system ATP-binding protein
MLIAKNITKKFSGVTALDDVCLELHPGKVNAIVGENGAGKSTLMKILSGVYPEYEGSIVYKNQPVHFQNARHAQDTGIAIIHQELNLIPYLTVRENIFLGREITTSWGTLNKKQMRDETHELLNKLKLSVSPDAKIASLKVGQQQVIEIAKALLLDAEVIIMDEPTSAISEAEVEVLFDIISQLKKGNKTIVYISHKLDELFRIADRYIVLRDGRSIESGNMQVMSHDSLIQKMVGREIKVVRRAQVSKKPEHLFSVNNICLRHREKKNDLLLRNISFTLNKGEILGIFGLMGAGRTELFETIFGMHARGASGTVSISNQQVDIQSPADAINAGLALVPEDRKKDGLVLSLNVRTNICLTTLDNMQTLGWLNKNKEVSLSEKYISDLSIKTSSDEQLAKNLSGGNQQKIVLAKWLATKPKILMLDEPTRGIDINAKNEIYRLILQLADEGLGIIVVSSELPEILALSDRILVMSEGTVTAELVADQATEDNILKAAIPKTI